MKFQNQFLLLTGITLFTFGCSTGGGQSHDSNGDYKINKIEQNHEDNQVRTRMIEEWTGRVGYLMAPPTFKTSSAIQSADPDQFQRCEKVRITKINFAFTENEFTVFLEQNKKTFAIVGKAATPAGQAKTSVANTSEDLWNIRDYFSDQLPDFQPATVKTTTGTVPTRDLACKGRFWKGMSSKEFTFVMGPPSSITPKTENGHAVEAWEYRVPSPGMTSSYYFENSQLRNWTR